MPTVAGRLAGLQSRAAALNATLADRVVDVQLDTEAAGTLGAPDERWATIMPALPCRIEDKLVAIVTAEGRPTLRRESVAVFTTPVNLNPSHRIIPAAGDPEFDTGRALYVVGTIRQASGTPTWEVHCEEFPS